MILKKILLSIGLLFFFFFATAQEKRKILPLKQILSDISIQHHVYFNFLEDEITLYSIPEPSKNWKLEQKIKYLQNETKLIFELNSEIYYSIFNKDSFQKKKICGYIFDNDTKKPISNVIVKNNITQITTATNEKGYFEFEFVANCTLQFSHINYEKKETFPYLRASKNCDTFLLNPQVIILDEIITQNYLTKGINKKIDGSITIKPKQMGLLPGLTEPDVFKTLQQIPGVMSVNESVSNLNIRGGTHDQNLVYWNGIRLFQTGHFYGLISALNPNLANTISLFKNGTSAFYGDSTSSTIQISTQQNEIEKTQGAAGINLINADFHTKIKTSTQSNLEISGRRSFTDIFKTPTYTNYANRIFQNTEVTNITNAKNVAISNTETFYFYDFTTQFHQKIKEKTNIFLNAIVINNQLNLNQKKTESNSLIERNSFLSQQTLGADFKFITQFNDKNTLTFNTYVSDYKVIAENQSIVLNQQFNQNNEIIDLGARLQNDYELNEKWLFKFGYQFNEIGIRNIDKVDSPDFFKKTKNVLQQHSAISEINFTSYNKKLKTMLGVRVNYFDKFSLFIAEPRLQFNYKLIDNLFFETLAEVKSQTVSQVIDLQNDFLGLEKRRWILANNDNNPISKSYQFSSGITFKKKGWLVTFDGYYKNVADILSRSQGFQNQLEFSNFSGNYTSFGTELLLQKKIYKFTNWITHSFMKNDYSFQNLKPSIFSNNFEIAHFINAGSVFENKNLQIAIGGKYKTGKPTTNTINDKPVILDNKATIIYKNPNSDNLVSNFQLQFSGSYSYKLSKKTKIQTGLSVENILDSEYSINEFYRINYNSTTIEKVKTNTLVRTVNGFIRVVF